MFHNPAESEASVAAERDVRCKLGEQTKSVHYLCILYSQICIYFTDFGQVCSCSSFPHVTPGLGELDWKGKSGDIHVLFGKQPRGAELENKSLSLVCWSFQFLAEGCGLLPGQRFAWWNFKLVFIRGFFFVILVNLESTCAQASLGVQKVESFCLKKIKVRDYTPNNVQASYTSGSSSPETPKVKQSQCE